jgi:hypothetical protein
MKNVAVFSSVLATLISVIALSHLALSGHDRKKPRTLSELVAIQDRLLRRFRNILWLCGTLFSVAMYGYAISVSPYPVWLFIAWTAVYLGDVLTGIVPARGTTRGLHEIFAQLMAIGMIGTACIFCLSLDGVGSIIEFSIFGTMLLLASATFVDTRRFIFYELPFLYLSHISIIVFVLFK